MKINQLADQLHAKTIALIAITKALEFTDLPNPHGGTPLDAAKAEQITVLFRFMRARQITDPTAAIAQMKMTEAANPEEIAVSLRVSVADELCRRYPADGSMSDRILRLLGALQSFEQLYNLYAQPNELSAPVPTTPHQ
ncbi:MAG: hypothetical protein AAF635_15045 [Cyanobacteria bacterium P01_C01_bin.69]